MDQTKNFKSINNQQSNMNNNFFQMNPMVNQMNSFMMNNQNFMNPLMNNNPFMINSKINQMNLMMMNNQNIMNPINPMNPMMVNNPNLINQMNPMIMNNPNLINQMNPMIMNNLNIMDPMPMINQLNQMNTNYNNISDNKESSFNIKPKEKNLIDTIIKFYNENNNPNMSYKNPNQIRGLINNLNPNYSELVYIEDNEDYFSYIKNEKITIKFINSSYIVFKVKIPKGISKLELYSIARLYKFLHFSKELLIYNNKILEEDESSIDDINDGDYIIIIDFRNYPDDSYYNYLQKKYQKGDIINIRINMPNGESPNLFFSTEVTCSEMLKAIFLKFGINDTDFWFLYNGRNINTNNESKIGEMFRDFSVITCIKGYQEFAGFFLIGKPIIAKTKINEKIIEKEIGTLNSTISLFDSINGFGSVKKDITTIYIGEITLKKR